MTLRRAHALSAGIVGLFVVLHLLNHLAALRGVEAHLAFMRAARLVYRQPVAEVLLLGCVAFQVASGATMLLTRRWPRSGLARVQAAAGIVIALFLLVHVSAVLAARTLLRLDTNFYFAAAGLHAGAWAWFFAPYYAGAVVALFVHLGCAAQRRVSGWRRVVVAAALGAAAALVVVLCLAGVLIAVRIPAPYRAVYG